MFLLVPAHSGSPGQRAVKRDLAWKKVFGQILAKKYKKYGAMRLLKMLPDNIWEVMQESVYEQKIQDVDELRGCTGEEWINLSLTLPSDSDTVQSTKGIYESNRQTF